MKQESVCDVEENIEEEICCQMSASYRGDCTASTDWRSHGLSSPLLFSFPRAILMVRPINESRSGGHQGVFYGVSEAVMERVKQGKHVFKPKSVARQRPDDCLMIALGWSIMSNPK